MKMTDSGSSNTVHLLTHISKIIYFLLSLTSEKKVKDLPFPT